MGDPRSAVMSLHGDVWGSGAGGGAFLRGETFFAIDLIGEESVFRSDFLECSGQKQFHGIYSAFSGFGSSATAPAHGLSHGELGILPAGKVLARLETATTTRRAATAHDNQDVSHY